MDLDLPDDATTADIVDATLLAYLPDPIGKGQLTGDRRVRWVGRVTDGIFHELNTRGYSVQETDV